MKQLMLNDIYEMCLDLKRKGYDLKDLPVYLGDDEELNGIHTAWYNEFIDSKEDNEEVQFVVDMINDTTGNIKLSDKGILIS